MKVRKMDIPLCEGLLKDEYQVLLLMPDGMPWPADDVAENFRDSIAGHDMDLLYLPKIVSALDADLLSYFLPEHCSETIPSVSALQRRIGEDFGITIKVPSIVCMDDGKMSLYEAEEGETVENFLSGYVDSLAEYILGACGSEPIPAMGMPPQEGNRFLQCEALSEENVHLPISREEYKLESLITELQHVKESQLRELGLSESALRYILGLVKPKLSHLTITRQSKIILEDYGKREIKLDDKTKALYFLFLRHPEGIYIKSLLNHYNELLDLYQSISGRDDQEAMRLTIGNLCDPYQNNANISLSRIKKAFCDVMTRQIASKYYVDGDRGGVRSISLERQLVLWETIR